MTLDEFDAAVEVMIDRLARIDDTFADDRMRTDARLILMRESSPVFIAAARIYDHLYP